MRRMLDGAQRWRQINSEHEEGADAMAQKKAGDSAIWGLLNRTSFTAEVHRSHKRIERGSEEKKGSAGGFGSSSGHRRLGRRCSRTFPFSRRRDGGGSEVDHRFAIPCLQGHGESVQRWWIRR